ncbi:MAG: type I-A CRISPR-associated protein Cas5a [Thermofilaceae archaeon]
MRRVYALLVRLSLHSPISVFVPLTSISADSFLLPPPTTLVGAIAYPYFRLRGSYMELVNDCSPAVELVEQGKVLYAAAAPVYTYVTFRTVERVYQHIYLRKDYWSRLEMAYTIAARRCTLTDQLYAFYLITDPELIRCAYGIVRVGRKEGLVSVEEVIFEEASKIIRDDTECETRFYFPRAIAQDYDRDAGVIERLPRLTPENFRKSISDPRSIPYEEYVVPSPLSLKPVSVILGERGVVMTMATSTELLCIPVPREVLEHGR